MINPKTDITEDIYKDEVMCFLADRYDVSPQQVIHRFLVQDGIVPETNTDAGTFRLEENEMEILRDLICGKHSLYEGKKIFFENYRKPN